MAAAKVAFHPDASAEYAAAFLWYYARGTTIAYDYHVGASGDHSVHNMKDEGVEDPVRWTLEQLRNSVSRNGQQAGYEQIAASIDQQGLPISSSGWSRKYALNTNQRWAPVVSGHRFLR